MRTKLYILDISSFIFRAYYALPPMSNARGEATNALYGFIRSLMKLMKNLSPTHMVAVFDGPDNKKQRREIYEKYKANRIQADEDLPAQMELAKQFCELYGIPHVEVPGVEADDTMGSIAKGAEKKGAKVFLCTSDKDLCQLVNDNIVIINMWKDNLLIDRKRVEEIHGVPPAKIIDLLAIMGDKSDNIPGLYGFGPKTAVQLLKEFGSLDYILKHPEEVKGEKKQQTIREEADTALLSRRLATIHTDIPFPKEDFALRSPDRVELKNFYLDMRFNVLVKELDAAQPTTKKIAENYVLVDDKKELDKLFALLKRAKEICFDVEATSLRPMEALPVGIGFGVEEGSAYYVPLNGKLGIQTVLDTFRPLFEDPNTCFYGHNAKYDCHVLENVGIKIAHLSFDTILASYLLNSHLRRHSLDQLALEYFGKVKTPIKSLIGSGKKTCSIDQVPIPKVSDYCCEDVDYTCRLKTILEEQLKKRKLEPLLFDLELPLSRVLQQMERTGMYLNVPLLKEQSKELRKELGFLEEEIYDLAGKTFNISSPKQLSKVLFEDLGIKPLKKTATGLSTRAEVLEILARKHPIAAKIIEYRTLDKLLSTYIEPLPEEINPCTGRIHPTFNQSVAATGRLACQDPNLQNIPVRTALGRRIRTAFRPQKRGWSFLAADYSQVELRLLAHLSGDPTLIKAFKRGEDIHAATASLIFDVPLSKVTKQMRHQAKAINFGIIYGQQAYGLSRELKIEIKEAAAFIEAYFERYPSVFDFVANCIKLAHKTGKAVTILGRERIIPEINSNNAQIRTAAERLAINTPLQGTAADLIKLAMLEIDANLKKKKMQSQMVLQIHDELIFEAPDSELNTLRPLVKKGMENVFACDVPILVDVMVGKNWGEC